MLIYLNGAQERRRASERKLRARADGALHARRRQLHRERRSRVGARLDRMARRSARRYALSSIRALHDDGRKTFLGRTGNFTGDDIVDIIFEQPQCARFFAASLLNLFVYNDPEPELVDRVAAMLAPARFRARAGPAHALCKQRLLQPARLSRAGEEPGRVRRRHL